MKELDWGKVVKFFIGFAIVRIVFDYFFQDAIDLVGVIGIPLIALGLLYLVDKKWLMKEEK